MKYILLVIRVEYIRIVGEFKTYKEASERADYLRQFDRSGEYVIVNTVDVDERGYLY